MISDSLKTYAMMRNQFVEWDQFASENDWANEALKKGSWEDKPTPDNCVAVYYVIDKDARMIMKKLYVATWSPEYKQIFKDLNLAWVEQFFKVEETDIRQLDHPEESIIKPGGQIFFLLDDNKVAGTVAMMIHDGECELGKMTVADGYQGKGYAHPLMREGIDWARKQGYPDIAILCAVKLVKAITLYKNHGFETVRLGKHPDYDRCDIIMSLKL
ncbi:hypothetical protein K7432_008849 [Basidiobolus ranarum]|uniref:N-acetyltransferase domain-containing protein n=1 Tax=Basidiobolus ranarum TaxID=34480 RepID=A0ABR2VY09_9FUNG